jgi:hypothetical protein
VRRGYDLAAPTYLADRPDDGDDVALLLDLAAELPPGAVVVDAGCGAGEPVARVLADLGTGWSTSTCRSASWRGEERGGQAP